MSAEDLGYGLSSAQTENQHCQTETAGLAHLPQPPVVCGVWYWTENNTCSDSLHLQDMPTFPLQQETDVILQIYQIKVE